MTSKPTPDDGLRARKRAATQARLERAALTLALEHGYDGVTVDMICDAGLVSQRTFFNYFGTKEGVFLGTAPPVPTDADLATFVHGTGADILGDLVGLITAALVGREPDPAVVKSRRMLIECTPELLSRENTRIAELEEGLTLLVLERFHAQGRAEAATPDLGDEACMVVALAGSVMRFSMQKWFSGGFAGTPSELLRHSIALVGRITGAADQGETGSSLRR
jgi:AcrR family transcriptional regulator